MKVLLIGSGGREHALAWKIAQSPMLTKLYAAPGNAGISELAECISIAADNIAGLLEFALREKVDLTVVGPEVPLVAGMLLWPRNSCMLLRSTPWFIRSVA